MKRKDYKREKTNERYHRRQYYYPEKTCSFPV